MDVPLLLIKTVLLRPYVFAFLAAFLFSAHRLLGWRRTWLLFGVTWTTAFVCEYSSTRTGIPFGWYHYTGSTVGQELYLSNIPFMDSLSFTFLLFASYCLALLFLSPAHIPQSPRSPALPRLSFEAQSRDSLPVCGLTVFFYIFIDMVIDPVALRGDRWFLGKIYDYPDPGVHFGVPLANYVGWAVVGIISLAIYIPIERRMVPLPSSHEDDATAGILLGCGLYLGVLLFNLGVTFWIGETLQGMAGLLMYAPVMLLATLRLMGTLAPIRTE
jgi:putative membrane protein